MTLAGNRWLYLLVFAPCALLGALILSLGRTTIDNIDCKSSKYREGDFLAYCQSKQYGDYEHGALYYGLEPGVHDSIRNAKVIFLGTSTTQAAFSTQAVRAYFNKIGMPFFVMGFGYGEVSPFALAVLKRSRAAPQVLVISADPFFFDRPVSEPALETLAGKPDFVWRLTMKMMFQRVHRVLCAMAPFICSESMPSIFRSARDGQWNWIGPYVAERTIPIALIRNAVPPERLEPWRQSGERFLDEVGMDRRCVVLTGIPSPIASSIGIAQALAAALGTSSIFPPADSLATVDGGHLNLASAERWSGQFLDALTPILRDCLAQ
jgi:hypothetical protein